MMTNDTTLINWSDKLVNFRQFKELKFQLRSLSLIWDEGFRLFVSIIKTVIVVQYGVNRGSKRAGVALLTCR